MPVSSSGPSPSRQATGMPWMFPEGVSSLVLMSAWASTQMTRSFLPALRQCAAMALMLPMARLWSPPISTGIRPSASSAATASRTARFHSITSGRWR